jgi:sulfur-oxidizing protein SoxB
MVSRREFLQAAVAVGAIAGGAGGGTWQALAARQQLMSEADLLQFPTTGNVTLVHVTDIHAQLNPILFPRAVNQSRRRRSRRQAAARDRRRFSQAL